MEGKVKYNLGSHLEKQVEQKISEQKQGRVSQQVCQLVLERGDSRGI